MKLVLGALLSLLGLGSVEGQEPIRFARQPDISPDGRTIAFSYLGDIWTVETIGGVARPVTAHEAHDTNPVFSPDGRSLAFSSNRHGSYDVFVVPVHGGRPRRLTFDSASDQVNGWSPDGKSILFTSRRGTGFPAVADLYVIPAEGGRERKVSVFEGRDGVVSPDGKQIAYVRGPGTWYRKGYRGSANNDIWISQADGTNNRQLTNFNGQDASPMWSPDGQTVFYVSEQADVGNVFRIPSGGGTPVPVTRHKEESVRNARMSRNGEWMVYEADGDLWVCSTQGEPSSRKVAIEAYADDKNNPEQTVTFTQNISEYALSPNEQHVAFVVHGELFLMPITGGKARRLTEHAGNDHDLAWSPDGKKLVFVSDRTGSEDIYLLEHNDPDHPELVRAHQFKVTQLTKDPEPHAGVGFAPDGKRVAFLRGGKLWTMNPDGSDAKALVDQTRVIEYEWSPDSKWLAYSRMDAAFASELYLVPAGGGTPTNITRYATRNFGMSWSGDGKRLAFISQRRQDLDVFVMSMHKPAREGDAAVRGGGIDLEDIHLRVDRATALSSDESETALRPDGSQVVFRSNSLGGDDLWLAASNGSQISRLTTGNLRPRQIRWSRSGGVVYFLDGNGSLRSIRPGFGGPSPGGFPFLGASRGLEGGVERIAFTARMRINRDEEFLQMFDESWRKLSYHFYDPKYHGANWAAVRLKYRPLVKHVNTHEEFYDLVSFMLGELNASHLGIGGRGRQPDEQTADLGLIWDESYRGPGLKIAEVLKRGPADRKNLDLKSGEYVMAIDGVELTDGVNVNKLLNEKAGEGVSLQIAIDPKDPRRKKVEVQPAARQAIANLMYHRWVENNAKRVGELAKGRFGYIHIRSMDGESLDDFVRQLYSDNFDKEAIVLDVRYNGGGFTHDQVLSYLGGKEHTYFVTREGSRGAVLRANDRKWSRPLVLLCNNRSYSDAEIFPSAFRNLGLGKLVGMPTGGYVIGTVNEQLIDGSMFRVPRLGVFTSTGVNMERAGVVPDVVVDLHPDQIGRGQDAQLDKAVDVLTKDVEAWKQAQRSPIAGNPPATPPTPGPESK